jgi:hypothetical protein
MKKFFLLSVAATLICSLSFATIRRVGFFGPAVSGVDYTTLQLAHNAASAGDTIMMMPGSEIGGNVSKTLVIIGPGYFLNPADVSFPGNAGLQANSNSNANNFNFSSAELHFKTGSSNTQVIGCITPSVSFDDAGLTGILMKRCLFTRQQYAVTIVSNITNITFQQCNFQGDIFGSSSFSMTNLSFLNCLIEYRLLFGNNSSGLINNCILSSQGGSDFSAGAWQISNCIIRTGLSNTNIVSNNSICTGNQLPLGNGNQQNKAWNTIFNLTGSYDGKYALKAGSPAIGAGLNGTVATDCGIFGGATPYRLSGIPSVPTIYALTSPQGTIPAGNTVQINLSTRSNN